MFEFNFDEWVKLAETDPAGFELKRKQEIDKIIADAPVHLRNKLRMLQLECDIIYDTYEPLDGALEMTKMAVNKLKELKGPLTQLRAICEDL